MQLALRDQVRDDLTRLGHVRARAMGVDGGLILVDLVDREIGGVLRILYHIELQAPGLALETPRGMADDRLLERVDLVRLGFEEDYYGEHGASSGSCLLL